MKSKNFLLIIRLKKVRGYSSNITLHLDTKSEVWDKVEQAKDEYKDRYKGFTLY